MIYFQKIENYKKFLAYRFIYIKIKRMTSNRLTKQITEFYENRSKAQVDTVKWIDEVKMI